MRAFRRILGVLLWCGLVSHGWQAAAQETLFGTTLTPAAINQSPLSGSPVTPLVTFDQSEQAVSLAFDPLRIQLYWIDGLGNRIRRTDGLTIETVVENPGEAPRAVDVDPVFGHIYWTDVALPGVKRANLDGGGVTTILAGGFVSPQGIAVDPVTGRLFVSDSEDSTITSANLDGSDRRVILNSVDDGVLNPVGLAVNIADRKIYWAQASEDLPQIARATFDGTEVQSVAQHPGGGIPWALAIDLAQQYVYWSDPVVGTVHRAPIDGSLAPVPVRTGTTADYFGIAVSQQCTVLSRDTDGDGTADCLDECPADSGKNVAGICGCNMPDIDSDLDLFPDCLDACPTDGQKILPLFCGCGVPDTDSDFDLIPDCADLCPDDFFKTDPGRCGCNNYEFLNPNGSVSCLQFPVLTPGFELELPPEIFIDDLRNFVTLTLQKFSRVDLKTKRKALRATTGRSITALAAKKSKQPKPSIQYRVILERGGKIARRLVSKRNQVTIRKLPPGSYTARYSVETVRGKKIVNKTNFSPAGSFTLT